MKKLLLVSAVSAALATTFAADVSASTVAQVHSDVTGLQLWAGTDNLLALQPPGYFSNFAFSGFATDVDGDGYIDSANMNLDGIVGFSVNGYNVRLNFGLTDGGYAQGAGITFRGGGIEVNIQTTEGWVSYSSIDATYDNLYFLANQPGHMAGYGLGQTTAGIVRDKLPGLWNGVEGGPGFNRGASVFALLGQWVGLYLQGDLKAEYFPYPESEAPSYLRFGPPEVPLPGAVWLFGSALAGLAGVRRLRR